MDQLFIVFPGEFVRDYLARAVICGIQQEMAEFQLRTALGPGKLSNVAIHLIIVDGLK
jgi:hypothetical protein